MIIDIKNLKKDYKMESIEVQALRGINLQIPVNEYVAIMGPSGSGKSTLMNILGCLDTPSEGKYFLNSVDVTLLNDNELSVIRNKNIGFVFPVLQPAAKDECAAQCRTAAHVCRCR